MSNRPFDEAQPQGPVEKSNLAKQVMGLAEGKEATHAPKFHRISIERAENGANIEHTHVHNGPKARREGASSPMSGPEHHTAKIVIQNDHPIMKHVQAIHDHVASQSDCAAGSGNCKG